MNTFLCRICTFYLLITITAFAFLVIVTLHAKAQIAGPFIEGENVKEKTITVRCMPTKYFINGAKAKDFRMVVMNNNEDPIIKMIFMNTDGEVVIVNALPDGTTCLMDAYSTGSSYSNTIRLEPKTTEQ
jgi:hypothetical protein